MSPIKLKWLSEDEITSKTALELERTRCHMTKRKYTMRHSLALEAVMFIASPEDGLHSSGDRDKLMALIAIADENCDGLGNVVKDVRFSAERFVEMLGLVKSPDSYDDIKRWCSRMVEAVIVSQNSSSENGSQTTTQHLFDSTRCSSVSSLDDESNSESLDFEVELSQWLLDNLNGKTSRQTR